MTNMKVRNMAVEVWATTDAEPDQATKAPEQPAPSTAESARAEQPSDATPPAPAER